MCGGHAARTPPVPAVCWHCFQHPAMHVDMPPMHTLQHPESVLYCSLTDRLPKLTLRESNSAQFRSLEACIPHSISFYSSFHAIASATW